MQFGRLEDSPMLRQQMQSLEDSAESLKGRCLKFHKGCRKYAEGLGEGYEGDMAFANAFDFFGGGLSDSTFPSGEGSVVNNFANALREIGSYKEVLRMQVENMLNDRLLQFVNVEMQEVKEARKRFDRASIAFDQAREKFMSLKKSTRMDVAASIEEELRNARSTFEQARFNLISALSNVEANRRFEFLAAVSGTIDAHLRYFKQGYELLHQMEPLIEEVLTYAQNSRDMFSSEQASLNVRMQEYKKQVNEQSKKALQVAPGSPAGDVMNTFNKKSQKVIEEVMQSATNGKVQIIRQGYLSKRSSNLRADWKRRYFVLDSRGMLYYYRKQLAWSLANQQLQNASGNQSPMQKNSSSDNGSGLLGRWLSSHYQSVVNDEKTVAHNTVNLLTATIKVDAEQSDLRFCFRIISPSKVYTLQAENAVDQMDWIEKITGVIASLLAFQINDRCIAPSPWGTGHQHSARECDSSENSDADQSDNEESTVKSPMSGHYLPVSSSLRLRGYNGQAKKPIQLLRSVSGNDKCADCGEPEPDWASLNLGILICIECSGIHRNLGVHISKVRSLTLDVKVWDASVLNLFQSLGNTYANSIWEELLGSEDPSQATSMPLRSSNYDKNKLLPLRKPCPDDPIAAKDLFIHAKYEEKRYIRKMTDELHVQLATQQLWASVRTNDKKAVYRYIVNSVGDMNAIPGPSSFNTSSTSPDQECDSGESSSSSLNTLKEGEDEITEENPDKCPPLHLACQTADLGMIELLLQYGADINSPDSRGRTPLHHCILSGRIKIAKLLLIRGADPKAVDKDGSTALQLVSQSAMDEVEVFTLLREPKR